MITWTCHICKDERPDECISVWKKPVQGAQVPIMQNIRYCNDRSACREAVKDFEPVNLLNRP